MLMLDIFFYERSGEHRELDVLTHSCPTRRSTDLTDTPAGIRAAGLRARRARPPGPPTRAAPRQRPRSDRGRGSSGRAPLPVMPAPSPVRARSEEHTSELQSLMRNSYAVFCLKKKIMQSHTITTTKKTIPAS